MTSEPTDKELVAAIRATRGQHGVAEWATTWDMLEHLSKYPPRVVLTCLGKLIETGAIGGCVCGLDDEKGCYCRGDFEVIGDFETDSRPKVWVDE